MLKNSFKSATKKPTNQFNKKTNYQNFWNFIESQRLSSFKREITCNNQKYYWERLDKLKIGNKVAIVKEVPYFGTLYEKNARLLGMLIGHATYYMENRKQFIAQINELYKTLPDNWQQYDKQSLQELIGGLFDINGKFSIKDDHKLRISYVAINENVINDIQTILQKFGVNSKIQRRYNQSRSKIDEIISYALYIRGKENIENS